MNAQMKAFSAMTLREMVDGIGHTVLTQDAAGEIRIAILKTVNCKSDGVSVTGLTVNENGIETVWQTEWVQAVFA